VRGCRGGEVDGGVGVVERARGGDGFRGVRSD